MKLAFLLPILIVLASLCACSPVRAAGASWWVQFPTEGEVVQRRADDAADLEVRVFDPEDRDFSASMDGGDPVPLKKGSDHVQRCALRNVPKGEHRLTVSGPDAVKVLDRVGVGDVHGAIGQSHTSGRNPILSRSADGRTNDPTNLNEGAGGSWFPLLSDSLTQERGCPQKFVNMAWGGAPADVFLPRIGVAGVHISAVNQTFKREGVKYVMFLIGATNAMQKTPKDQYKAQVTEIVKWLQGQGYTVLLAVMPNAENPLFTEHLPVIQQATREMWEEIPGVYPGADLTRLPVPECLDPNDKVHLNAEGYRRAVDLWTEAYRSVP
ncbi:MAG: hypothetical protein V2A58_07730 [Planctomycetota bacterium]